MKDVILVHIHHFSYCNRIGGTSNFIRTFSQEVKRKGVEVEIWGTRKKNCKQDKDIIKLSSSTTWWRFILGMMIRLPKLKRRYSQKKKNIILHIHRPDYVLPLVLFRWDVPIVLTLHGEWLADGKTMFSPKLFPIIERIYQLIVFFAIQRSVIVVPVSKRVWNSYANQLGGIIVNKMCKPISTGIDTKRFTPLCLPSTKKIQILKKYHIPFRENIILVVGRLEPVKRPELALYAFKEFLDKQPDSHLIFVGDGKLKERLVRLTHSLGLSSNVSFLGSIPNDQLPDLYHVSDVVLISSINEASPIVPREALACGVPVVSTPVGDVELLITNRLLGKISQDSATDISKSLLEVTKYSKTHKKAFRKYKDLVKRRVSLQETISQYLTIYSHLSAGGENE